MHNTIGGEYNATAPAYSDKQLSRLQVDANGRLLTTVSSAALTSASATIANGQSLSGAIDTSSPSTRARRIILPSDLNGVSIMSAQSSYDGVTYSTLCSLDGTEWNVSVVASTSIPLDPSLFDSANYIKLRGGTSGSAQNTSADLVITVVKG